jgi:hypothetical protein
MFWIALVPLLILSKFLLLAAGLVFVSAFIAILVIEGVEWLWSRLS